MFDFHCGLTNSATLKITANYNDSASKFFKKGFIVSIASRLGRSEGFYNISRCKESPEHAILHDYELIYTRFA